MKEYKYIDKIVKDTISEMKVPVNSTWKDITEKIKNTPKEPVNNNNSFLSSLTSKIIASVLTAFSVIGANGLTARWAYLSVVSICLCASSN
jgi:hypothetical protein